MQPMSLGPIADVRLGPLPTQSGHRAFSRADVVYRRRRGALEREVGRLAGFCANGKLAPIRGHHGFTRACRNVVSPHLRATARITPHASLATRPKTTTNSRPGTRICAAVVSSWDGSHEVIARSAAVVNS